MSNGKYLVPPLVLTPYLPRTKIRKEKNLLSGSDAPVEELVEVRSQFYALFAVLTYLCRQTTSLHTGIE